MPWLTLGPAPVVTIARARAFPSAAWTTEALLARHVFPGDAARQARRRADLQGFVDEHVGVSTRAFVTPPERALDLAVVAAREAIAEAGVRDDIVAHVHATSTPSRWTGPEAARIGQALGLGAAFFDVRSGCTGGLWALVHAARLAVDAQAPVLVTAADAFSLAFAPDERLLPLSMGDGAGALVLVPGVAGQGVVRACFTGLPEHADLATVPGELPPCEGASYVLAGDAMAFSAVAEAALTRALEALAPPAGTRVVVQTGRADVARRVSSNAWLDGLRQHGNIGAPTALVALAELLPGTTAFVSAGGGLSAGALLWRDGVDA